VARPGAVARLCGILLLGLGAALPAAGQSLSADLTRSGEEPALELRLTEYEGDQIVSTLSEGMRSQVSFLVRLYRRSDLLFGVFGDRLVHEYRVVHEASQDAFRRAYRIDTEVSGDAVTVARDKTRYFESRERFLQELFRVRSLRLDPAGAADAYVLVQARVTPVRLVPALGLLSFFMSSDEVETAWIRLPISSGSATSE
jgi:hypothetical protein